MNQFNNGAVYDDPDQIAFFRLKALRGALKLEILGMRRNGRSVYAIIKEEFGFKGNKQKVLQQLEDKIEWIKAEKQYR